MTLNDIGKAMRSVLSAMVRAAWGITLCAGGLAVGIYNPQIEMFARFKTKSSFHKTKRII